MNTAQTTETQKTAETWEERMTRERIERRDGNKKIEAKFKLIAKKLGLNIINRDDNESKWTASISCFHAEHSGVKIWVEYCSHKKKASISSEYVRDVTNGYSDKIPSIYFSIEKPLERIVSDIQKRFIPFHIEYAKTIEKRIFDRDNYENGIISKMKELIGSEPYTDERKNHRIRVERIIPGFSGFGNIQVYDNDNSIELRGLSQELTLKIIDLIKGA